eukprot:403337241
MEGRRTSDNFPQPTQHSRPPTQVTSANNLGNSSLTSIDYVIINWDPQDLCDKTCQNIMNSNPHQMWSSATFEKSMSHLQHHVRIQLEYPPVVVKHISLITRDIPDVKFEFVLIKDHSNPNSACNQFSYEQQINKKFGSTSDQVNKSNFPISNLQKSNQCFITFSNKFLSLSQQSFTIYTIILKANKEEYEAAKQNKRNLSFLKNNPSQQLQSTSRRETANKQLEEIDPKEVNVISELVGIANKPSKNQKHKHKDEDDKLFQGINIEEQKRAFEQIEKNRAKERNSYIQNKKQDHHDFKSPAPVGKCQDGVPRYIKNEYNLPTTKMSQRQQQLLGKLPNTGNKGQNQGKIESTSNTAIKQSQFRSNQSDQDVISIADTQSDQEFQRALEESKKLYELDQKRMNQRGSQSSSIYEDNGDDNYQKIESETFDKINIISPNKDENVNNQTFGERHGNNQNTHYNDPKLKQEYEATNNQFGLSQRQLNNRAKRRSIDIDLEDEFDRKKSINSYLQEDPQDNHTFRNDVPMNSSDLDEEECFNDCDIKFEGNPKDQYSTPYFEKSNKKVKKFDSMNTASANSAKTFGQDSALNTPIDYKSSASLGSLINQGQNLLGLQKNQNQQSQFQINPQKFNNQGYPAKNDGFNLNPNFKFDKQQNGNQMQQQPANPLLKLNVFDRYRFMRSTINIVPHDQPIQSFEIHPLKQEQLSLQALMLSMENEMKRKIRMKVSVLREEVDEYQEVAKKLKDLNFIIAEIRRQRLEQREEQNHQQIAQQNYKQ